MRQHTNKTTKAMAGCVRKDRKFISNSSLTTLPPARENRLVHANRRIGDGCERYFKKKAPFAYRAKGAYLRPIQRPDQMGCSSLPTNFEVVLSAWGCGRTTAKLSRSRSKTQEIFYILDSKVIKFAKISRLPGEKVPQIFDGNVSTWAYAGGSC